MKIVRPEAMIAAPMFTPTDTTIVPDIGESDDFVPTKADARQAIDGNKLTRSDGGESDQTSTSIGDSAAHDGAIAIGTRDPVPAATSGVRQADDGIALPGLSQLYWFERDIDQKIERYKRDGKDPHDLFDPSKTDYVGAPGALLPYFGTELSAAAAKSQGLQTAQLSTSTASSDTPVEHDLTPIPVHSDGSTTSPASRPWLPTFPATPEWEDHFIRGTQGLIHALRGRLGRSRKEEDNDFCYRRYDEEERRCYESDWQVAHPDYTPACIDRAKERLYKCIRNGGQPHPNEPPEWRPGSDYDEETWRNLKR